MSCQPSHHWIQLLIHTEKMARNTWNSGQTKKSLSKEKIKRPWQDGCPVQVEGVETNFSPLPSHTFTLKHFPVTLLNCHHCTKASWAWKQSLCQSCHVSQNRQAAALWEQILWTWRMVVTNDLKTVGWWSVVMSYFHKRGKPVCKMFCTRLTDDIIICQSTFDKGPW